MPEPNPTPPAGDPPVPTPPTPPGGDPPTPAATVLHEVKIDGETRRMTTEELVTAASKVEGAEAKFKAASDGRAAQELVQKLLISPNGLAGDEAQKLARLVGGQPEDFMVQQPTGTPPANPPAGDPPAGDPPTQLTVNDLDPATQEDLKFAKEQRYKAVVTEAREKTKELFDKDEKIGKLVEGFDKDDDRKGEVKSELFDMVFNEVSSKVRQGQYFGPDLISTSIRTVEQRAKKLGIQSATKKEGNSDNVVNPLSSIIGTTEAIPSAEILQDEPLERVASTEEGYEDNFLARLGRGLLGKK